MLNQAKLLFLRHSAKPELSCLQTRVLTGVSRVDFAHASFLKSAINTNCTTRPEKHTVAMSSYNQPPWRRGENDRRGPSIPSKRSADTRSHDHPSKRSTNAQEEAWVADEDRFVLQQAKKRAALRVKGGRAKPIDWLAVILRFVDTNKTLLDEEVEDNELDVVDPEGVLEGLGEDDLSELEKEIENYLTLETSRSNREYWTVSIPSPCRRSHADLLGSQSHMQRPSSKVSRSRSPRYQFCQRRHRSSACPEDIRAIRNIGGAGEEEA